MICYWHRKHAFWRHSNEIRLARFTVDIYFFSHRNARFYPKLSWFWATPKCMFTVSISLKWLRVFLSKLLSKYPINLIRLAIRTGSTSSLGLISPRARLPEAQIVFVVAFGFLCPTYFSTHQASFSFLFLIGVMQPVPNAIKLLQACIFKSVNTDTLTTLVATCIVKFTMLMLNSKSNWYLKLKTSINIWN